MIWVGGVIMSHPCARFGRGTFRCRPVYVGGENIRGGSNEDHSITEGEREKTRRDDMYTRTKCKRQ